MSATGTTARQPGATRPVSVAPPRPLLSRRAEEQLGPRHREVLDQLEALFLEHGFASFSVRELAAALSCSRRTLYELAPSKNELVLLVLDRFLHRVGRTALDAIDPEAPRAEQIRAYFVGGVDLQRQTTEFADDIADEPGARRLLDRHFRYVMAVLEDLIGRGVTEGEFRPVNASALAAALTGSGMYLTQPEIVADLDLGAGDDSIAEFLDLLLGTLTA